MKQNLFISALIICLSTFAGKSIAQEVSKAQIKGLDEQVQEIKKDVLGISAELALLEEKLLYPSNTQVSIFVSFADKDGFRLDAMDIKLDGKEVVHHLYTAKELDALRNGGVQKIYTGNIRTGEHQLEVIFLGKSALGGSYKEKATHTITKGVKPKLVEVKVAGSALGDAIEFKEW
ncbi:MAG: hypothetical protein OEZ38_07340 [Gammaproteobacteria bacterium]|nr:hypothetical protein [Gammaproteobacteria bacterium]